MTQQSLLAAGGKCPPHPGSEATLSTLVLVAGKGVEGGTLPVPASDPGPSILVCPQGPRVVWAEGVGQ